MESSIKGRAEEVPQVLAPRWRRARLAVAHDAAAEVLWAEIACTCQRPLSGPARVEAAVATVLALFERDPSLAGLLVVTAPGSFEAQLLDRHRMLRDHLVDLLRASLTDAPRGTVRASAVGEAVDRAFALTAARLGEDDGRGVGSLARPLSRVLLAPSL